MYLSYFEPPAIIFKEGFDKYIFLQTFIKAQLCNNPLQYFRNSSTHLFVYIFK